MVFFKHVYFPIIPKIEENPINGKRHYKIPNGKLLPSVTTALSLFNKGGIDAWRRRVGEAEANRKQDESLKIGTEMHKLVEDYLNNSATESEKTPMANMLFEQLKPELHRVNNIRAQEIGLYSEKLGVAGRMDCLAEYDGVLSVIDFKSANGKKKPEWIIGYFLQTTAYSLMIEELTGIKAEQLVIMMSAKDKTTDTQIVNREDYRQQLLDVLEDYHLRHDI